ncbi:MAG TPA: DUF2092 domain-containing protein [Gemmataceae bacterium]|nr:DUF2092 domain-containing protein [Gemmataceae bacterium]
MRYLLATALLALAAPASAQPNEAEKLYRAFEKKLAGAKAAYKFTFEIEMTSKNDTMKIKGDLLSTNANQMRFSFNGTADRGGQAKVMTGQMVCDGRQMQMAVSNNNLANSKTEAAPDQMSAILKGYMTRIGLFLSLEYSLPPRPGQTPDQFQLAGFKMAGKEKVGNVETQVIEYTVTKQGEKDPIACKLWIDVKSGMPLKRMVETSKGGEMGRIVELYTEWQIDPKLKGDEFTLPK